MTNIEKLKLAEDLVDQVFMDMPDNRDHELALSDASTLIKRVRIQMEVKSQTGVLA